MESDPRIGAVLDQRYQIIERIAEGGMGTVYKAERVKLGRTVAIKFLHAWTAANAQTRKRFDVEARAMARLDHPNCSTVIDFGVANNVPYVVMEYASGETLRKVLDRGPIGVLTAVEVMRQILLGLAHAHEQSIIHRDIKPANVMVGQATGVGVRVKLLDFGLARLLSSDTRLTAEGKVLGTPAYMAPEQTRAGATDERSDIYACGVLLFEMLTGRKPFDGDDPVEILQMQRSSAAPPMSSMIDRDFGALEHVVARALSKEPSHRFQTAGEMASALDLARYENMQRHHTTTSAQFTARVPRTIDMRRFVVAGLVALLLVGIIVAVITGGDGTEDNGDKAVDAGLAIDAPGPVTDGGAASVDAAPELPELTEAKQLIARGRREQAIQALQDIERFHPGIAEVPYLLGKLYFAKLWTKNGTASYRRAIMLQPSYRTDKALLASVIRGFAATAEERRDISKFIVRDIGAPARPWLDELARKHKKKRVRKRAERLLKQLPSE